MKINPLRPNCVFSAALLLAGCTQRTGDQQNALNINLAQIRDSAGIQIVEFAGSVKDLPPAFQIDPTPIVDFGGPRNSQTEELSTTSPEHDARRLPDGRIVVRDVADLKVFDATGKYLFSIGRAGDGPGEFGRIRGMCVTRGDTIVALERQRASVFSAAGTFVRTFETSKPLDPSGCFSDGSLLTIGDVRPDSTSPAFRVSTGTRISSDGKVLSDSAILQAGLASPPLPVLPSFSVFGEYVYYGDGRAAEIRVHRANGGLSRIVRWNDPGVALTDEGMKVIVGRIWSESTQDSIEHLAQRFLARPQPSALPRYQSIQADAAGRFWVLDYPNLASPSDGAAPAYTVFDSIGHPLGRVAATVVIPAKGVGLIRSMGRDEVVVRWRDSSDFAHLTFHRLMRVK